MKPQFIIKENEKGKFEVYYVERYATFFKKEILKPYVTWSGLDEVFEFSTIDVAISELKKQIMINTDRI